MSNLNNQTLRETAQELYYRHVNRQLRATASLIGLVHLKRLVHLKVKVKHRGYRYSFTLTFPRPLTLSDSTRKPHARLLRRCMWLFVLHESTSTRSLQSFQSQPANCAV